jgi:hypothetical protein
MKTDLTVTRPKMSLDMAWKICKAQGAANRTSTGIGFCQFQQDQHSTTIFIQAPSKTSQSPLEAEALALLLVARVDMPHFSWTICPLQEQQRQNRLQILRF